MKVPLRLIRSATLKTLQDDSLALALMRVITVVQLRELRSSCSELADEAQLLRFRRNRALDVLGQITTDDPVVSELLRVAREILASDDGLVDTDGSSAWREEEQQ
ncbi:hypothetical protein [Streptomyces luteireticuli]|uniref:hypothetical protein n=1 Tax=Streptomyces luteireticuli TaxID=173858 RepID=UPI0035564A7B